MDLCRAVIAGVLEVECETVDDVMSYLERGSTHRHTGLTRMNDQSSRSHSVFTLVIGTLDFLEGSKPSRQHKKLACNNNHFMASLC